MLIVVLGSAAGGGFPQWNCNAPTSREAWRGNGRATRRTQTSVAVSADGERWLVVCASPDFRQQILATPRLQPRSGLRHSPIEAVLLTGGEIDGVAGLLSMRESQAFHLYAPPAVLALLGENPIFGALSESCVRRCPVPTEETVEIAGPGGPLGLSVSLFAVPGKVPLFLEGRTGAPSPDDAEMAVGAEIGDGRASFHFVPGCAAPTDRLRARLRGSRLVFFDGTLWRDDELLATGVGQKTGRRMGHMSIDGPDGTIAALADLEIGRKIFIHVNTTNPVLIDDSPERTAAARAGWEVAEDGMEIEL